MEPLSRMGEFGLIRWIKDFSSTCLSPAVLAGIGDDAAVLAPSGKCLLATTDAMVEGVHFDLALETPYQVGYRALVANVSDIHAMNGTATSLLIALGAPPSTDRTIVEDVYRGIGAAAAGFGVAIAGGDTVASPHGIMLSLSLLGECDAPVYRSGAREGDGLYLSGAVGHSALGLMLLRKLGRPVALERGEQPALGGLPGGLLTEAVRKHVLPDLPQVPEGASSMIDVSDGLLADAGHLAEASGLGVRIERSAVPLGELLETLAPALGRVPIDLALGGGEDYALLFTLPQGAPAPSFAQRIGVMTADGGIRLIAEDGSEREVAPRGWEHFRSMPEKGPEA